MATILEEVLRLGVDPNLAIAAMSMPSRANITGATRYTIPGEGTSEFIRPKTADEIAVAARALGEAATPNRFAGRMIGDSPGQAQGYALQGAQMRQQAAQFAAQMAANERRAQEQAQLRRELVNTEWQSRQGIADRNREAQIMEAVARLSRTPGGAGTSSARTVRSSANRATAGTADGPTIADILYGEQARLFGQQPGIEASNEALGSLLEGRTAQATALFGSSGAQRALDQSILSADEAEAIGVDPYTTIAEAVRTVGARGPGNEAALKMLESRIAAERASGRLSQALPQPAPVTLSPLAQILRGMPATVGSDGMLTYTPAQTAEALTRLGWRGAYGDPAAQARAAAMSRYRAMGLQPTVEPEPAPTPARQGFGDLRVSESAPITQRFVVAPRSGTTADRAATYAGGGPALGWSPGQVSPLSSALSAILGSGYRPDPATMAEVEARRQAGEFPATTEFVNKYPAWVRQIFALPGEPVPASSAYPQGAGSVADFTDVSAPVVAPSAIERLLTNGYPSPTPINGTFNLNDSVGAIADLLRGTFARVGQAGRNVLEGGYPSPTPIGGGTFNLADAMPTYGAPTPYANPIRDAVVAGYPSPAPINGTFNMNDSVGAIADILRAVFSRVGQAGRNVLEYGYPSPAPVNGTFDLNTAVPIYR